MSPTASPSGIQTTVVGSYPIPSWLAAQPTTGNLRDAVLVVLKTQELAGIDVVTASCRASTSTTPRPTG